jgi:lipopolysaccharide/colanic/teichoic acid biosynthesis glycosyltransferase
VNPAQIQQTTLSQFSGNQWQRHLSSLRRIVRCQMWALSTKGAAAGKRLIDVAGALSLMVVLAPMLLLVAIAVKLTDRGPVIFWQDRVGRFGKTFRFPKFRSMVINAESLQQDLLTQNQHGNCVTFKMKRDPRITWIGRIIRRGSIDELPQLWCVLKGEMSLVGPRPALVREVANYTTLDRRRLEAIPGLTCFWQVLGRAEIPFPQQVELDVNYIENQSLLLDIKLLAKTVPAVISGRGAY